MKAGGARANLGEGGECRKKKETSYTVALLEDLGQNLRKIEDEIKKQRGKFAVEVRGKSSGKGGRSGVGGWW